MVDNSKDEKITPLQEKLDVLAKKISTFAICAGITTFIVLTINLIFIYISDYKLFHGLRGAAHAWGGGKIMNIMIKKWIKFILKHIYFQEF